MSKPIDSAILIDQVCDQYEAQFHQSASFPELESFLDSVFSANLELSLDPSSKRQLLTEIFRTRFALLRCQGQPIDLANLLLENPQYHAELSAAAELDARSGGRRSSSNPSKLTNLSAAESGQAFFVQAWSQPEIPYRSGDRLGDFELQERLGQGGMGTVWRATQQQPIQREVAVKLIRSGRFDRQMLARFSVEQQALAVLEHPHIAHLFDARQTGEGQPFLVMELVPGPPITQFADLQKLNLRQRIELFIPVCRAVHHAHQKGIIHRDLKPSNILVSTANGEAIAKVIDFGLAKATATQRSDDSLQTQRGQVLGTPDYMSPEQTKLGQTEVDTRSDIYSLGAVLYELLTGQKPFQNYRFRELPLDEALKIVREIDPVRPSQRVLQEAHAGFGRPAESTLDAEATKQPSLPGTELDRVTLNRAGWRKSLRGELDWIVGACLAKDPTRRYESAAALAADLERHLAGEPVQIAPPSRSYQLKKLVSKHWGMVIAASAIFLALTTGLMATLASLSWAWKEQARAEKAVTDLRNSQTEVETRARELEQVASFQSGLIQQIDPDSIGTRIRVALLDQEAQRLRTISDANPADSHAERLQKFDQQISLADFTGIARDSVAAAIIEPAISSIGKDFADQPVIRARLLNALAATAQRVGMLEWAESIQQQAVEIYDSELGAKSSATLEARLLLGSIQGDRQNFEVAATNLQNLLQTAEAELGAHHPVTIGCERRWGTLESDRNQHDLAEALIRSNVARCESNPNFLSNELQLAQAALGKVLDAGGKFAEAEQVIRELLAKQRELLDPLDVNVLQTQATFAGVLIRLQQFEAAEMELVDNLEAHRKKYGLNHHLTLTAMGNLAGLTMRLGRFKEGYSILLDWRERSLESLGPMHASTLGSEQLLGYYYFSYQDFPNAIKIYEGLLEKTIAKYGEQATATLNIRANLAANYLQNGQQEQAIELLGDVYSAKNRGGDLAWVNKEYIKALIAAGKKELAIKTAREEMAALRRRSPAGSQQLLNDLYAGTGWFTKLELWEEAKIHLEDCIALRDQLEPDAWQGLVSRSALGQVLLKLNKVEEAEAMLRGGVEELLKRKATLPRPLRLDGYIESLIEIYTTLNDSENAEHWQQRLKELKADDN